MDLTGGANSTASQPEPVVAKEAKMDESQQAQMEATKAANKWGVEVDPEATLQAIAEARAYAEANAEMVVQRRRGRPPKNPAPDAPPPTMVPKRVSIPKFRPPPKPARRGRKKKRDDSDDDSDSEGDFVPGSMPSRSSSTGRGRGRPAMFSDGDMDSDEEEAMLMADEDMARSLSNSRVSLRARRNVNYAAHFADNTDDEDEPSPPPKRKAAKKATAAVAAERAAERAEKAAATRARSSSVGDAYDDEDDDEEETDEYNKPTRTGLVPDMAYRSFQIERILAFRPKRVDTDDPHSFPPESVQPNKLAGPTPPPEGSAAAIAWQARASGGLTDVLMTLKTVIPGLPMHILAQGHPYSAILKAEAEAAEAAEAAKNGSSSAVKMEVTDGASAPSGTSESAAIKSEIKTETKIEGQGATSTAPKAASSGSSMDVAPSTIAAPVASAAAAASASTNPSASIPTTQSPATSAADEAKLKAAMAKPVFPLPKPLETSPSFTPGVQYEFLVKYKNRSFVHCEWVPQVLIERAKLGKQRLQRFLAKGPECDPDSPFDIEYLEVDRVLDSEERDGTLHYFVKWQGLPYSESTWESSEEVNDAHAVAEYERHNELPAQRVDYNAATPRPPPGEWKEIEATFKDDNQLRMYQKEGMNWLRWCWYNRRNSILADEMGLGKTVQTVSMLWYLFKYRNVRGPFMIIAPLSTIPHWRRELENWTDMNCIVYHGNSEARQIIRDFEFFYMDDQGRTKWHNMFKFHVIVTTYEMILTDSEILRPIRWKYVAIDEAHRLKNKSSRVLNELLSFSYDHLLLLTGTPIQNNTQELWTLLNLLDPVQFSSAEDFVAAFGNLKDSEQVKRLHDILKPFLLRRIKRDVDKTIAPKEETIIEVELTTIQKKYYRAILERSFDNLVQGSKSRSALPSLLNIMMQLRKCCNHPYLLRGVEETEIGVPIDDTTKPGSAGPTTTLIESSGKLVLIDKLLPRLKEEGHKILIFSQMVRVIDILQEYLVARSYKFERIDGSVRGNDRQAAIDRFSKPDSDIFVFLLCTRAGGVGINLTAADTVIIFDSDWNPQNDLQAQARCHRIGQQKRVKVYRLLTRGTYERVMFERASLKLGLDQAVLSRMTEAVGDGEDGGRPKFTSAEVDALLKHGAYDLFREDDNAAEAFREANIEDILQSRTTHIVHDQANETGSTFSKASFTSEHADTDLDVNDPDFWKKVMPHQAYRPNPNIIEQPRQRKQRQRIQAHDLNASEEEELLEDMTDEEDAGNRESDDEAFEFDGDKRNWRRGAAGTPGDRARKPTGPVLPRRKWNITQRNRFVRTIQLLGFGRWREIKRNAKLTNKSLWEIACYGRAYIRILLRFAGTTDGDSEEQVLARIANCEDGTDDLSEDPWRSTVQRHMVAYEGHKQESEIGVSAEAIKTAEEKNAKRIVEAEAARAREKKFIDAKLALLKEGKFDEVQKMVDALPYGNNNNASNGDASSDGAEKSILTGAASAALTTHPDMPADELPVCDYDPITIHWHMNDPAAIAAEVAYFSEEDPLLTDPKFLENMKSTATQALKRLELLADVGSHVRSNFADFNALTFPKLDGDASYFGEKWGPIHDRDLLVGTWRWGFGQYDRMVRDPLLAFYGFYKPKPNKERGGKGDDDDDDDAGDDDDDDAPKTPKRSSAKKAGGGGSAKRSASKKGEDGSMDVDASTEIPPEGTAKATAPIGNAAAPISSILEDTSNLLDMPPSKLLTHRVKHLLKALHTARRKRGLDGKRGPVGTRGGDSEKYRRKGDKENWSKREKSEYARLLQHNGIPLRKNASTGEWEEDWDELHARSQLHNKSAASMLAFYPDFQVACKYLAATKVKGLDEKIDTSLLNGMTEAQMAEKSAEYHMTGMAAKRVWERITTLDTMRRHVLGDGVEAKIARTAQPGYGFPPWWTVPQFDVALLQAVDKHGFGKWKRVIADPTLPFLEAAKANLDPEQFAKLTEDAAAATNPTAKKTGAAEKDKEEADEDFDKEDDDPKDALSSFLPSEKLLWKRVQQMVTAAMSPASESNGRANGKKKQATLSSFVGSSDGANSSGAAGDENNDMAVDDTPANKKKRRRGATAAADAKANPAASTSNASTSGASDNKDDLYDPVPKRPRGAAPLVDEVKIDFDASGNPILPINVKGVLSIESLGTINPDSAFHSEKYIWPVGYRSKREYASALTPEGRTRYTCEILASPDGTAPLFRVSAEDDPTMVCEASSPSSAWKLVLERVNKIRTDANKRASVSGPEYFGYGHPKVAELIAKLPGAEACARYHAAQVPVPPPQRKKRDRSGHNDDEDLAAAIAASTADKTPSSSSDKMAVDE